MSLFPGVYKAVKKNGDIYYRASITFKNKHISLGSFSSEELAAIAYQKADSVLKDTGMLIEDFSLDNPLGLDKWIALINYRDSGIYIKNPIYLKKGFFFYYININHILKFDIDDLFYYAHHKIMVRGNHLFVSDYGMQVSILSRYGIKNYAVPGKDYLFINGDELDFRYSNIEIINRFQGVSKTVKNGDIVYQAKVHINGDYLIGYYTTDVDAAIAYNKAVNLLIDKGVKKNYQVNFIPDMDEITYAKSYHNIRISKKIRDFIY
jgi:transposase